MMNTIEKHVINEKMNRIRTHLFRIGKKKIYISEIYNGERELRESELVEHMENQRV